MLKLISGFPESVIAVTAKGRVSARDYDEILRPQVEEALKRGGKLKLYYELGDEFEGIDPGAAWKDFKIGVEHLSRWERMALVTDVEWIRLAVRAFSFLMPGKLRIFSTNNSQEARVWLGGS